MRALGYLFAAAMLALSVPAGAVTYRFDVFDPDATQGDLHFDDNSYYFLLDSAPTPEAFDGTTFSISGTSRYSIGVFGDYAALDYFTFYTASSGGGFDSNENVYAGAQLFTGTTEHPMFRLGTFELDNFGSGASVTISDTSPAGPGPSVPEPATWALMAGGFGLVGGALRRRRKTITATA